MNLLCLRGFPECSWKKGVSKFRKHLKTRVILKKVIARAGIFKISPCSCDRDRDIIIRAKFKAKERGGKREEEQERGSKRTADQECALPSGGEISYANSLPAPAPRRDWVCSCIMLLTSPEMHSSCRICSDWLRKLLRQDAKLLPTIELFRKPLKGRARSVFLLGHHDQIGTWTRLLSVHGKN